MPLTYTICQNGRQMSVTPYLSLSPPPQYELVPLSTVGLSTAVRHTANAQLHQLVDSFENQFNDVCRTVDLVDTYRAHSAGQEMMERATSLHGKLTR